MRVSTPASLLLDEEHESACWARSLAGSAWCAPHMEEEEEEFEDELEDDDDDEDEEEGEKGESWE